MNDLKVRYQRVGDAKRFWEILNHPDFVYFPAKPKTIKEEREYLRLGREKRKNNIEHNFAILLGDRVVGAAGVMVDQRRPHIGEIGYFVDRAYWGRGIAPAAVKLMEEFALAFLGLHRIEITIMKQNAGSIRVAQKCGYTKEGIQRGKLAFGDHFVDVYSFAKLLPEASF